MVGSGEEGWKGASLSLDTEKEADFEGARLNCLMDWSRGCSRMAGGGGGSRSKELWTAELKSRPATSGHIQIKISCGEWRAELNSLPAMQLVDTIRDHTQEQHATRDTQHTASVPAPTCRTRVQQMRLAAARKG